MRRRCGGAVVFLLSPAWLARLANEWLPMGDRCAVGIVAVLLNPPCDAHDRAPLGRRSCVTGPRRGRDPIGLERPSLLACSPIGPARRPADQ